jgi:phage baseplate assembly protein W
MPTNTRTFTDLDLNFTAHPVNKDVAIKYDEQAIKQSVRNLILTKNFERPFHSEIGSQVRGLLFEPVTEMSVSIIKRSIVDVIRNYEPRVQLVDVFVNVRPDENYVDIRIVFKIINTATPIELTLTLERTR